MNMVFGQRFVFFCPFISTCSRISWYVVEFCSPFVDFQSCFGLVFLGFVNFCQFLLDLVEFGWLAFHFLVFWRFVFVLVAFGLASVNSSRGFPLFPFRPNSLPISFKFWAAFCQFFRIYMIASELANFCVNIAWFNFVYCQFLFNFWPFLSDF